MTITVEIPQAVENQFNENIARGDTQAARELLLDTLVPTVEQTLLSQDSALPNNADQKVALLDQLTDEFMEDVGHNCPPLSDYATSREGIYEEHP